MNTDTTTKLTSARVLQIFAACIFDEKKDTDGSGVKVEGITQNVEFNIRRLTSYKREIAALLNELSDDFKMPGGGGMSFLAACHDKHGNLWTDLHQRMEQLFLLGLAIGKVECMMPRKMWSLLPGGMPYYLIQ